MQCSLLLLMLFNPLEIGSSGFSRHMMSMLIMAFVAFSRKSCMMGWTLEVKHLNPPGLFSFRSSCC